MNAPRATASLPTVSLPPNEHWPRISTLPTTQLRIIVDLTLAVFYVVVCLLADMIDRSIDQGTQITVGAFIASMLGIGAVQFVQKRKTSFAPTASVTTTDETGTTTATATQGNADETDGATGSGGVTIEGATAERTSSAAIAPAPSIDPRRDD